jgi:hypothetical protein
MCLISSCGVNSVMDAILAGVPIIMRITDTCLLFSAPTCSPFPVPWPRSDADKVRDGRGNGDQIPIASQLPAVGLGVGLIHHRRGSMVGRKVAHRREVVRGTKDVLLAELGEALKRVQGQERDDIKGQAGQ